MLTVRGGSFLCDCVMENGSGGAILAGGAGTVCVNWGEIVAVFAEF